MMKSLQKESFVKGHDFSRADNVNEMKWALTPAIPGMTHIVDSPCGQASRMAAIAACCRAHCVVSLFRAFSPVGVSE